MMTFQTILKTRVTLEVGFFQDVRHHIYGERRFLCETHGDDFVFNAMPKSGVPPTISPNWYTKTEAIAIARESWLWCNGCTVMFEEMVHFPTNWAVMTVETRARNSVR